MILKRLKDTWDKLSRRDINDNWTTIEKNFKNVVDIVSDSAYDKVVESATLIWKEPVNTFNDLSTVYPNPKVGWTSMAREIVIGYDGVTVNKVYRYDGTQWKEIQQISADAVNEVDNRLTQQLAYIGSVVVSIEEFPKLPLENNDNARIERATEYIKTRGGGIVNFGTATYEAVNIKFKDRVLLIGQGLSTIFKQVAGSNCDFFTLENADVRHYGLLNAAIDGNKTYNSIGRGMYLNASGQSGGVVVDGEHLFPDTYCLISNVYIMRCASHGIELDTRMREAQLFRVFSFRNGGCGAIIGGTDNVVLSSVFYWNDSHGLDVKGASHRLNSIKCFGNKGHGYWFHAYRRGIGTSLEAQENYQHGFAITGVLELELINVISDANGYTSTDPQPNNFNGFSVYNSDEIRIIGRATNFHTMDDGDAPTQCYGIALYNTTNYDIDLQSNHQYQNHMVATDSRSGFLRVNNETIVDNKSELEIGTFTPTLQSSTATYTVQSGNYTKIKNRVFFDVYLVINNPGTSSVSPAVTLPFYTNNQNQRFIVESHVQNQNTEQDYVATVESNVVQLRNKDFTYSNYNNLKSGTVIRLNGSYRI